MPRNDELRPPLNSGATSEAICTSRCLASKPRKRRNAQRDRNAPKPKKGLFEVAQVEGEFINFDGNYRYALSAVDDLEKTMVESGKYFSVEITKRPLDIESDNRLSGDASNQNGRAKDTAEVAFRIVREVKNDE